MQTTKKNFVMILKISTIKNAADFYLAADEIYKIVLYDTSISEGKKKELCQYYKNDKHNLSVFISEVLIFSMCREKLKLKAKSPLISEIIIGCKANKPCKFFVGRKKLNNYICKGKQKFLLRLRYY